MKKYFIILIIALFIISCNKKNEESDFTNLNVEKPHTSTITDIPCALKKMNDYNFQATIHGKNLCLNSDFYQTMFNNNWVVWRNEIWMLKKDVDSSIAIGIVYKNPAFYNHSLPYTVDRIHHDGCEGVEVTIMNYKAKYSNLTTDDSQYQSQTGTQNLSVTITSFKDSIIEGTYKGDFYNRGGRMFSVTNGYFKTKLKLQN